MVFNEAKEDSDGGKGESQEEKDWKHDDEGGGDCREKLAIERY